MYSDRRQSPLRRILLFGAAALLVCAVLFSLLKDSGKDISEESAAAIREVVRQRSLQCYAVEGVYPPNLEYLEENYGLAVNRTDFYVT